MLQTIFEFFYSLPKEVIVFFISMVPIGELRAAIPLAMNKYQLGIVGSFFWAVAGNVFSVVIVVLFLEKVSNYLSKKSRMFNRFFEWLFERTRRKHSKKFELYQELALITFVAIPLPMTGGWSGAVAAFVFGIPPKKAIPLIALGVVIAGVVVTALTAGVNFLI